MTREHAYIAVVLVMCASVVGRIDMDVAEAAEKERQQRTREDRARIWSKKCEKRGQDTLAKQKDGGKWTITCVPKRTLTVGA